MLDQMMVINTFKMADWFDVLLALSLLEQIFTLPKKFTKFVQSVYILFIRSILL